MFYVHIYLTGAKHMIPKERVTITLNKTLLEKIDTTRELVPRSTYIEAILTGEKEPFIEVT